MISEKKFYKLRTSPSDFIVEEIINLKPCKKGKYTLYRLTKKNLDTYEAIKIISKRFNIPLNKISYCGMKDKHSLSIQFLTIPKKFRVESFSEKNIKLQRLFDVNRKLRLGMHLANKFTITLRKMSNSTLEKILSNINFIKTGFIPNYYDSQRFGSIRGAKKKFIFEEIIKKNYEGALKIFLTGKYRKEKGYIKEIKEFIKLNWGNWSACKEFLKEKKKYENFFEIIGYLESNPHDYIGAIKLIRKHLLTLYISAYQSFIWNEAVKKILKDNVGEKCLEEVEYLAGSLYFLKKGDYKDFFHKYGKFSLPLPSSKIKIKLFETILSERGVNIEDIDRTAEVIGITPAKALRRVLIKPKNLEVITYGRENGNFLTLSFILPPGSYGTVVLKSLLAA